MFSLFHFFFARAVSIWFFFLLSPDFTACARCREGHQPALVWRTSSEAKSIILVLNVRSVWRKDIEQIRTRPFLFFYFLQTGRYTKRGRTRRKVSMILSSPPHFPPCKIYKKNLCGSPFLPFHCARTFPLQEKGSHLNTSLFAELRLAGYPFNSGTEREKIH